MDRMDRNYSFSLIPNYINPAVEMVHPPKPSSGAVETTLASIRRRLSNAVLTVPYGPGLDSIKLLTKQYDEDTSGSPRTRTLPIHREQDRSENFSLFLKRNKDIIGQNRPKPERFGSNRSKFSDISRTSSNKSTSKSEGGRSRIAKHRRNLTRRVESEKVRLKEPLFFKTEHIGMKDILDGVGKFQFPTRVNAVEFSNPQSERIKIIVNTPESKQYGDVRTETSTIPRNNVPRSSFGSGQLLHPPPIDTEIKSVFAHDIHPVQSVSGSSNNSIIIHADNDQIGDQKKRHVGFNLDSGETLRFPPINSTQITPLSLSGPKSILKKTNSEQSQQLSLEKPKVPSSVSSSNDGDKTNSPEARWQLHLPRLRSPVPPSASRRQPVAFKRSAFQLRFRCSKEFETAASELGSD